MGGKQEPRHLGDGAYVEFDGFNIYIRANHHTEAGCTDQVVLDEYAFRAFVSYMKEAGVE